MILDALIAQFQQRFQHEKRAQVCLWFDDKGEFTPLLPAFREHLSAMQPPPFVLLEYDPDTNHGQIWLKHRVYTDLAALGPEERKRQRYVFYLPLSEDRLETPDDKGRTTWSCSQNTVSPAFCGGWGGSGQRCLASCATPESSSRTTLRNSAGSMTGVAILYWPNTWLSSSTSRRPSGSPS